MRESYAQRQSRIPLVLCITVFLVTFFLNRDFGIRYLYNYFLVAAVLMLAVIFDGVVRVNKEKLIYVFLAAVIVVLSFLPTSVRDPLVINTAIAVALFTVCCLLAAPSEREMDIAAKTMLLWGGAVTCYLFLVKLFPGVYWASIYPHLSTEAKQEAISLMREHSYGVAMGGSAVYIDYILALSIFICAGVLLGCDGEKRKKLICLMLGCFFLVGMVLQNRRSELLAVIMAVGFILVLNADPDHIGASKVRRIAGAVLAVMAGVAFMLSRGMLDRYIETFANLTQNGSAGVASASNGRLILWNNAFQLFKQSPVFGIGWRQFSEQNNVLYMEGNNVHNDYLQWLCETGIVGFLLIFIPFFYLWIKAMLRCLELNKMQRSGYRLYIGDARCYALISCAIQTFFLIMHCIDPCFYKLIFWPIFTLAIILYNLSYKRAEKGINE